MIVKMFKERFARLVETRQKRQTVRPWPKRMPKIGETISLRQWEGKPYRSKQRILLESRITELDVVGIDAEGVIVGTTTAPGNAFAAADGFSSFDDLFDWFQIEHKTRVFIGILYKWE